MLLTTKRDAARALGARLLVFAAMPVFAGWFLIRRWGIAFTLPLYAALLLTGAAALFLAVLFQSFFPANILQAGDANLKNVLLRYFFRISFTEELARLVSLLCCFAILKKRRIEIDGVLAGLVSGLGFAVLEAASYSAAGIHVALLRAFTAAPLHGACGARVGQAASGFRERPAASFLRFFSAVAIHGMYNFIIIIPGPIAFIGIFVALFALGSSIVIIRDTLGAGDR